MASFVVIELEGTDLGWTLWQNCHGELPLLQLLHLALLIAYIMGKALWFQVQNLPFWQCLPLAAKNYQWK